MYVVIGNNRGPRGLKGDKGDTGSTYQRVLTTSDTIAGLGPGSYTVPSVAVATALGLPENRYGDLAMSGPAGQPRSVVYRSTEIDKAANPSRSWVMATDNAGSFSGRTWRELTSRTRGVPGNYATDLWATRPGYNGVWAVTISGVEASGSHNPTQFSYNLDHETQPNGGSVQRAFATHEGDQGAYFRAERSTGGGEFTLWKRLMDERMSPALNRHELLFQEMAAANGGKILTGDAVPVALTFDDYPRDFRDRIKPLLEARGLPCTIGLSSKMYDPTSTVIYAGAEGTTWAEIDAWPSSISIANHSATHMAATDRKSMDAEIVIGLKDLRAALPNKPIHTFMQPSVAYDAGFDNGNTLESYAETIAGHMQLGHHAYVTGTRRTAGMATTCVMVGNRPIQGLVRNWLDTKSGIDIAQSRITSARAKKHGLILAAHADRFGLSGMATIAEITAFFDWLKAEQDAGRVKVLKLEEFAIAQYGLPSPVLDNSVGRTVKLWDYQNNRDQLIFGETGERNVASWFPAPATVGTAKISRTGNVVTMTVLSLTPNLETAGDYLPAGTIPSGFRPTTDLQGYPVISDINKRPYDGSFMPRSNGSVRYYAASLSQRVNFSISWTTSDPWPTSLPGSAVGTIPYQ